MADAGRPALLDVMLRQEISTFNFFQLVELLHRCHGRDQTCFPGSTSGDQVVRYKATASLGFHRSDVVGVTSDARGAYQLEVAFIGLHGSQSPMPGYYLDGLAWEYAQNEQRLGHFLDFFHHRLLGLVHQIWRKYRYHVRMQENGGDSFSNLIFALVGLGLPALAASLPVTPANLLARAGLLASSCRSPAVVAGLVAHCFELADVVLRPWQTRNVAISQEQQNSLGLACSTLGDNWVVGSQVNDLSGKFSLVIKCLGFSRFLDFLPNGKSHDSLLRFVCFVMRDQLAWDLELALAEQEARGLTLGNDRALLLGWSTFLGRPQKEPFVTIRVQG